MSALRALIEKERERERRILFYLYQRFFLFLSKLPHFLFQFFVYNIVALYYISFRVTRRRYFPTSYRIRYFSRDRFLLTFAVGVLKIKLYGKEK